MRHGSAASPFHITVTETLEFGRWSDRKTEWRRHIGLWEILMEMFLYFLRFYSLNNELVN